MGSDPTDGAIDVQATISAQVPLVQNSLEFARRTYAAVTRRVVFFLFVCYGFAFLDRVNIGFAKLQMQADLNLTEAVFGLAAGIFFIPYFFLEIPSNLALKRFGARRWIARIMVTWGVLSAATAFVTTPTEFYVVRFLLGAAEAGFFPGIVLYLTYWYPAPQRAKALTLFLAAIPFSSVVGGPLSGWVMHAFANIQGLKAWQALFLIEGIPSIVLGVACWFYLDDSVEEAGWLDPDQRALVKSRLDSEQVAASPRRFTAALKSPQIWLMTLTNFALLCTIVVVLWLPSLYKKAGLVDVVKIGWLAGIPHAVAIVAMLLVARNSDRTGERRWHTAVPAFVAATGAALMTISLGEPFLLLVSSCLTIAGAMTLNALFWTLPTAFLAGTAAVVGIAFINCVGQLAGLVAPIAFGAMYGSGSAATPLLVLAALYAAGGIAALLLSKRDVEPLTGSQGI
jgi:sugar phosphate permease